MQPLFEAEVKRRKILKRTGNRQGKFEQLTNPISLAPFFRNLLATEKMARAARSRQNRYQDSTTQDCLQSNSRAHLELSANSGAVGVAPARGCKLNAFKTQESSNQQAGNVLSVLFPQCHATCLHVGPLALALLRFVSTFKARLPVSRSTPTSNRGTSSWNYLFICSVKFVFKQFWWKGLSWRKVMAHKASVRQPNPEVKKSVSHTALFFWQATDCVSDWYTYILCT